MRSAAVRSKTTSRCSPPLRRCGCCWMCSRRSRWGFPPSMRTIDKIQFGLIKMKITKRREHGAKTGNLYDCGEHAADPGCLSHGTGGDTAAITAPGQFVNIRIEGCYLRRPISVADWDENTLTLIYKVVGEGTKRLSRMGGPGAALDLLVGLGNGMISPAAARRRYCWAEVSGCRRSTDSQSGCGSAASPRRCCWDSGARRRFFASRSSVRWAVPRWSPLRMAATGIGDLSPICCGKPGCGMITFIPAARRECSARWQKPAAAAVS